MPAATRTIRSVSPAAAPFLRFLLFILLVFATFVTAPSFFDGGSIGTSG